MNALKTTFAALAITLATAPAFADEGTPPDLLAKLNASVVATQTPTTAGVAAPQYLPGLGEVSLVPNPAFVAPAAPERTRVTRSEIKRNSIPATKYVGA